MHTIGEIKVAVETACEALECTCGQMPKHGDTQVILRAVGAEVIQLRKENERLRQRLSKLEYADQTARALVACAVS